MDADAAARLIDSWGDRAHKVMGDGLRTGGEEILAAAIPVTPIRTGALRASGRVHGPDRHLGGPEVSVVFGGPSANYAIYVHEIIYRNPYWRRQTHFWGRRVLYPPLVHVRGTFVHHPVGAAKFLENPGYEMAKPILGELKAKGWEIFKPRGVRR